MIFGSWEKNIANNIIVILRVTLCQKTYIFGTSVKTGRVSSKNLPKTCTSKKGLTINCSLMAFKNGALLRVYTCLFKLGKVKVSSKTTSAFFVSLRSLLFSN